MTIAVRAEGHREVVEDAINLGSETNGLAGANWPVALSADTSNPPLLDVPSLSSRPIDQRLG